VGVGRNPIKKKIQLMIFLTFFRLFYKRFSSAAGVNILFLARTMGYFKLKINRFYFFLQTNISEKNGT
jgi:hypothetical protein